jgi:hypothetical protein
MERRAFLAAGAAALGGCLGGRGEPADGADTTTSDTTDTTQTSTATRTSTSRTVHRDCFTTRSFDDPTKIEPETTDRNTATGTRDAGCDVSIHHPGPLADGERRVLSLVVRRVVADGCDPAVFAESYALDPGDGIDVEDAIGEAGDYRIEAHLENGQSASRDLAVGDGGIAKSSCYQVQVRDGAVEILAAAV